jgi:hypothetical protein
MSEEADYANFGANQPGAVSQLDPVACAINNPVTGDPTSMFTCAGNPQRTQLGLIDAYMSQRCSNKWDGYCDLFLQQNLKDDYTGKHAHTFIRDTLMSMFCQNDARFPGSECATRCEQFDPTSSSSFSVCKTMGDVVFRSSGKLEANNTDFNQSGRLQTAEPIKIGQCPKVCDLLSAANLTDDNKALNIALDNGIAMDLVQNLVENIISAGMQDQVTNSRLKDFMSKFIQDGGVKPGLYTLGKGPGMSGRPIATPAVNPYLPPKNVFLVKENRGIEGVTPVIDNRLPYQPYIPYAGAANPPVKIMKEGYAAPSMDREPYLKLSSDATNNKILYAILAVSIAAVAVLLLAKRK